MILNFDRPGFNQLIKDIECGNNTSYAIVLVLFILLVIILGSRTLGNNSN